MTERELYFLITFSSTTQAMAFDALSRQEGIPGRLIPLPGTVAAGCGLAFAAPHTLQQQWSTLCSLHHFSYEKTYTITL